MNADELERHFQDLPPAPRDDGAIALIVLRLGDGAHATPARASLVAGGGVAGDRWSAAAAPDPEAQVTLMERRVAALVTGGDPARLHLPGDNFLVDLDLSLAALPPGTRLRLGTAVVEISAKPHTGCAKFRARVGDEALRWVNAREHRDRRLRGVNARIVEGGEVAVGDRLRRA